MPDHACVFSWRGDEIDRSYFGLSHRCRLSAMAQQMPRHFCALRQACLEIIPKVLRKRNLLIP